MNEKTVTCGLKSVVVDCNFSCVSKKKLLHNDDCALVSSITNLNDAMYLQLPFCKINHEEYPLM